MITLHLNNNLDSDLISTTIPKPSGLSKHPKVTNTTDQGKNCHYVLLLNYLCDAREWDLKKNMPRHGRSQHVRIRKKNNEYRPSTEEIQYKLEEGRC